MATLIAKNAVKNPKKGEFYFVKGGSVYAVKPNRKGGKKGRKVCGTKKHKPAKRKSSSLKKFQSSLKKTVRRKSAKRKSVKRKK